MTPKEKAIELMEKYDFRWDITRDEIKNNVLIAVDELIKETQFEVPNIRQRFWQEVKQEIEKL